MHVRIAIASSVTNATSCDRYPDWSCKQCSTIYAALFVGNSDSGIRKLLLCLCTEAIEPG
ncbi:hypothetical protein H6F50_00670 [Coleofasciculus sp. FACHB-712]|uniref:hypothetical protein n=1 Tax=Coleofasciculus sp. FACHB-712 TaxID=2692789 RepID=UPI00168774EA|nr:hypothetical protein [Coleofasciculus sp. FACHB-712]MBD1940872.1 hypothetical protein [Coleofasciculus sp. FACHB-712]